MSESDKSLEQRLGAILSDPNAMSTILGIVKGLNGTQNIENTAEKTEIKNENPISSHEDLPAMALPYQSTNNKSKSLALLLALKPFLSSERAHRLDTLTGLLRVLSLTDFLK